MLKWLYERVTGTPWVTEWRASVEFGPPPGAVYQQELAAFSDLELLRHGDEIVAALRARDRRRAAEARTRVTRVGQGAGVGPSSSRPEPRYPEVSHNATSSGQRRSWLGLPLKAGAGQEELLSELPQAAALFLWASALAYPTRPSTPRGPKHLGRPSGRCARPTSFGLIPWRGASTGGARRQ